MSRFDNPIYPRWFKFPDLAAMPDFAGEERNDAAFDPVAFDSAAALGDINYITSEVGKYTGNVDWLKRVEQQARIYRSGLCGPLKLKSSVLPANSTGVAISHDLIEDGISMLKIDMKGFDVQAKVDQWLAKEDWQPPPGTYDRGEMLGGEYVSDIQQRLINAGVLQAASAYRAKQLSVQGVYLHISTPTDSHYKQFLGYDTSCGPLTNMHIDPKEDCMKAIIYLEDIGEKNGPFKYVPKSNRFVFPAHQEIMGRAICTGNYMMTPEQRSSVFRLPAPLRVSYNFGRAMVTEREVTQELMRFARPMLTEHGVNCSVFDAGAGMHQGGYVEEGRRVSLQVLMK